MRQITFFAVATAALALAACGGSGEASSDAQAVEARIARERADAAREARQAEKVKQLQSQVRQMRKKGSTSGSKTAPPTSAAPASSSSGSDIFHAPSGNVSCEVAPSGASCSVAGSRETFVLRGGSTASIESGLVLGRSSGTPMGWGTTVSSGSITCSIPRSDEPRGISCHDAASGHGFEASRVPSRQKVY